MRKWVKRMLRNEKGLTLVELLAVIVILGIIAAIAVPSITGIINKTKTDARKAVAVQMYEAARLYALGTDPHPTSVTLTTLQTNDYLPDTLNNPETGSSLDGSSTVTMTTGGEIVSVSLKSSSTNTIVTYYGTTYTTVSPSP